MIQWTLVLVKSVPNVEVEVVFYGPGKIPDRVHCYMRDDWEKEGRE